MPDPTQTYTAHALDVTYAVTTRGESEFALTEPAGLLGACKPGEHEPACAPWGAPARIADARAILAQTRGLLELLQKAQRAGELTEAGLCELEHLARFYTALLRQVDQAPG